MVNLFTVPSLEFHLRSESARMLPFPQGYIKEYYYYAKETMPNLFYLRTLLLGLPVIKKKHPQNQL
jgi:hypothetical protein